MKKNISIAFLVLLFSCKKEEAIPAKSLVGTRWSSFSYKSVLDGSNVYKILFFVNTTEVEYYSATEKTKLVGTKEVLSYEYVHPKLTITRTTTVNNNKPFVSEGNVFETFLNALNTDYTKD